MYKFDPVEIIYPPKDEELYNYEPKDYSEYIIHAQKLIRGIGESANEKNYKKAFELAYHLETLSVMLKESLIKRK
jgi:hypothetical protein